MPLVAPSIARRLADQRRMVHDGEDGGEPVHGAGALLHWRRRFTGPWPVPVELGRATASPRLLPRDLDCGVPPTVRNFSVPSWSQPVKG